MFIENIVKYFENFPNLVESLFEKVFLFSNAATDEPDMYKAEFEVTFKREMLNAEFLFARILQDVGIARVILQFYFYTNIICLI